MVARPISLTALFAETFRNPAQVGATIHAVRFDRGTLWSMLLLVSIVSALAVLYSVHYEPSPVTEQMRNIGPFAMTAVTFGSLTILVFALYFTAQMMGGTARFPGTLLAVIWWQAVSMALQAGIMVLDLVAPPLAALAGLVAFFLTFYWLAHFMNEINGFGSLLKAFGVILMAFVGMLIGLFFILSLIMGAVAVGGVA